MLGGQLGGGRDLDDVGLAERALGEGGEPAQRLDLVVEQVDADGALLRGGVDVEQAAADGELAAVLDLVVALVAGRDEVGGASPRGRAGRPVRRTKPCGRSAGSGTFSERATAETTTTGASPRSPARAPAARPARPRAGPTRCGGRREVRLVGHAAARVEAHGPRAQPRAQVGGEVAGRAVVAGHHRRSGAARRGRPPRRSGTRAATARRTRARPARRGGRRPDGARGGRGRGAATWVRARRTAARGPAAGRRRAEPAGRPILDGPAAAGRAAMAPAEGRVEQPTAGARARGARLRVAPPHRRPLRPAGGPGC